MHGQAYPNGHHRTDIIMSMIPFYDTHPIANILLLGNDKYTLTSHTQYGMHAHNMHTHTHTMPISGYVRISGVNVAVPMHMYGIFCPR